MSSDESSVVVESEAIDTIDKPSNETLPSLISLMGDLRAVRFVSPLLTQSSELKKMNKLLSDKYSHVPSLMINASTLKDLDMVWEQAKKTGNYKDLTRRQFVLLCSLQNISKEEAFIALLETWEDHIPDRALPILLTTLHQTWGNNPNQESIVYVFTKCLKKYSGNRSYLRVWSNDIQYYCTQDGITKFAQILSSQQWEISTLCSQYHIPSSSSLFVELIRKQAISNIIEQLKKDSMQDNTVWLYLFETLIQQTDYQQLSELIVVADTYSSKGNSEPLEFLKQWFLDPAHYGDPRIYQGNWSLKITGKAIETFIKWLSKEDLKFFFDLLLRKGEDEHGRRAFWEQYLGHVVNSRVLISDEDWIRNEQDLKDMKKANKTVPARMKDPTSAFIMQLKEFVVIEFSEVGNACYIFNKNDMPKTLSEDLTQLYQERKIFEKSRLINAKIPMLTKYELRLNAPSVRVSHNPPDGWQAKPRGWLEAQGIRPL